MPKIRKTRRAFLTGLGGLAIGSAASPLVRAGEKLRASRDEHADLFAAVHARHDPDGLFPPPFNLANDVA